MIHEKAILREDGSWVKITVDAYTSHHDEKVYYSIGVASRSKGKRKWVNNREATTPAEILAAKMELWQKMKPE